MKINTVKRVTSRAIPMAELEEGELGIIVKDSASPYPLYHGEVVLGMWDGRKVGLGPNHRGSTWALSSPLCVERLEPGDEISLIVGLE